MATDISLAFILQPLVNSGFVEVTQVGTLAQLSSNMRDATLEEDLWACMCRRFYPGTKNLPTAMKETRGYRWIFKAHHTPKPKSRLFSTPLAPPSCRAEDLFLSYHVQYKNETVAYDCVPVQSTAPDFLEEGLLICHLKHPIVIRKPTWAYSEQEKRQYETDMAEGRDNGGLKVQCTEFDPAKLRVRIEMFNQRNMAMCCLFDSVNIRSRLMHFLAHLLFLMATTQSRRKPSLT